jgi:hypothetical protein
VNDCADAAKKAFNEISISVMKDTTHFQSGELVFTGGLFPVREIMATLPNGTEVQFNVDLKQLDTSNALTRYSVKYTRKDGLDKLHALYSPAFSAMRSGVILEIEKLNNDHYSERIIDE